MAHGSVNEEDGEDVGSPTATSEYDVTYTATDNGDGASATATYKLKVHDRYDNWRRVDAYGIGAGQNDPGEPGDLTQLAQDTHEMPATPVLSYSDPSVNWSVAGNVGGGVLAATGTVLTLSSKLPTWPSVALGLAGLTLQTASSLPTSTHSVSPPDAFGPSLLQSAYGNYQYNQNVPPGEPQNDSNLVDANFNDFLARNQDFEGYFDGRYGAVSVDTTLSRRTLNYYFHYDAYDEGGLVGKDNTATVHRPGGLVWKYVWHYGGNGVPLTP